ncbi:hypothetical protein IM697_07570 [Streptomyces ferrugineus]|uniref:Uncharacterized protein n=1 Tax=Streptomyces ferrugineus TaxID=1413221 RepID=A0A7M2SPH8_9ACTN|nr:hypothetical protein [Streptomyces ferrugineus]QOV38240.1 hypothetical protein IM697_07570 [Streptomyces ferrugineus]
MPAPKFRHLATSALCAALFLGTAAPALAASPGSAPTDTQAQALAGLGTVTPVTDLLNRALRADDDPLTDAELKELADEAKEAVAQARKEAEQARKDAEQDREDAIAEAKEEIEAARKEAEEIRKEALAEAGATSTPTTLPANLTSGALDGLGQAIDALLGALGADGTDDADAATEKEVETSAGGLLQALLNLLSPLTGRG